VQCFAYSLIAKGNNPLVYFVVIFAFIATFYYYYSSGAIVATGHARNEVKQIYFALPAIFFVAAMLCSNLALSVGLPYPIQVLGKCNLLNFI
jgi:hypothetical protein